MIKRKLKIGSKWLTVNNGMGIVIVGRDDKKCRSGCAFKRSSCSGYKWKGIIIQSLVESALFNVLSFCVETNPWWRKWKK